MRSDLQRQGLGWALLGQIIDYAKAERIGRVEGFVLGENTKMLEMCREFGFRLTSHPSEPGLCVTTLELE